MTKKLLAVAIVLFLSFAPIAILLTTSIIRIYAFTASWLLAVSISVVAMTFILFFRIKGIRIIDHIMNYWINGYLLDLYDVWLDGVSNTICCRPLPDGGKVFWARGKEAKSVLKEVLAQLRQTLKNPKYQDIAKPKRYSYLIGGWQIHRGAVKFVYEGCSHHETKPQIMTTLVRDGMFKGTRFVEV